jgi:hypothetical protein
MVLDAHNGTSYIPGDVLGPIRNLCIALHQGTDSALTRFSPSTGDDDLNLSYRTTYPLCQVTGHIHDVSASTALVTLSHTMMPACYASLSVVRLGH